MLAACMHKVYICCVFFLCSGADSSALNITSLSPFTLAIQIGYEEAITSMMTGNPAILKTEVLPGITVIKWALDKRYAAFFKVHKINL